MVTSMVTSTKEFIRRLEENEKEWQLQRETNSFDITKYHGFDCVRGSLPVIKLLKKTYDIYAAIMIGVLPYLGEHNGADAVELDNAGNFEDIELKTCYSHISPKIAFSTKQGTIYFTKDVDLWEDWVDKNKTCLAKSQFSASFDIKNNRLSKNRKTCLLCFDGDTNELICVYALNGLMVVKFLETSSDIKLGSFMSAGAEITNLNVPIIGWDNWIKRHIHTLKEKRCSPLKAEEKRLMKESQKLAILQNQ